MRAGDLQAGDVDPLDQLLLIGVHGVEPIDHVMLGGVGGGVAQGAERAHLVQGLLALAGRAAVYRLGLVDDDHGPGRPHQIDGAFAAGPLVRRIEDVGVQLVQRTDGRDHDLDRRRGGEVAHLAQLGAVVDERVHRLSGVQRAEVIPGHLQGLGHAFADGHRRHDYDEFGETIQSVQFENGAQVDVCLARARLHLDREIQALQRLGRSQGVMQLHVAQIGQDLIGQQGQTVADPQAVVVQAQLRLGGVGADPRHREFGAVDFLALEQVADRSDGLLLERQVGFETQFHTLRTASSRRASPGPRPFRR